MLSAHVVHRDRVTNNDLTKGTFSLQHVDDLKGMVITEELPPMLFMKADAMLFDESNKVFGGVPGQSTFYKMRVEREKVLWATMNISEVTSATATDSNFFAECFGMIEHQHTLAPLAGHRRTEEAGSARANHNDVPVRVCCHFLS